MTDKKHILIYCSEFPNPIEPLKGTFIERILSYYPEEFDIKVVAPIPYFLGQRKGKLGIHIPKKQIVTFGKKNVEVFRPKYILFPKNFLRPLIGILQGLFAFKTISNIHKNWNIHLIHVHFSHPDGIAVRQICKRLDLKYIITEHRGAIINLLHSPMLRSQLIKVYNSAAKVIAVSEFTRRIIIDFIHSESHCVVIPNGVELSRFVIKPRASSLKNIVFVGNLIYSKGIHVLISSIAELKRRHVILNLSIIGDGKYKKELVNLAHNLDLDNQIQFLGTKRPDDIDILLPTYDLLVLPSFIESFSVVIIEAMAAGLPVIATKCGGPEYIVESETGLLINPDSVSELTEAFVTIQNNWNSYNKERIREIAEKRFDMKQVVRQTCLVYKEVLGKIDE